MLTDVIISIFLRENKWHWFSAASHVTELFRIFLLQYCIIFYFQIFRCAYASQFKGASRQNHDINCMDSVGFVFSTAGNLIEKQKRESFASCQNFIQFLLKFFSRWYFTSRPIPTSLTLRSACRSTCSHRQER